uniref:Uncharacterized protein n=1 Tax=Denticeps clupeoides TaxID=299321 RepID=A0AAY4A612_9TELE
MHSFLPIKRGALCETLCIHSPCFICYSKNVSCNRPVSCLLYDHNAEYLEGTGPGKTGYTLLSGCSSRCMSKLQLVQNAAARVLTRTRKFDHITPVLQSLHWLPIKFRID